jgi:hypothetical protein
LSLNLFQHSLKVAYWVKFSLIISLLMAISTSLLPVSAVERRPIICAARNWYGRNDFTRTAVRRRLKGHAIEGRYKQKDAYDIYYCIRNYPGGPETLAEECRPLLDHASGAAGYGFIAGKFDTANGLGRHTCVDSWRTRTLWAIDLRINGSKTPSARWMPGYARLDWGNERCVCHNGYSQTDNPAFSRPQKTRLASRVWREGHSRRQGWIYRRRRRENLAIGLRGTRGARPPSVADFLDGAVPLSYILFPILRQCRVHRLEFKRMFIIACARPMSGVKAK